MMLELNADELKADAEASKAKSKMTLEEITALGERLNHLQERIDNVMQATKILKEQYDNIAEKELPEAMSMLGLKYFGLNDGSEVNIQDVVACSINDSNRAEAHRWLRDNGHGDIIKNEITVVFGKDEEKYAALLQEQVEEMTKHGELNHGGLCREERVHPQTLVAFVRSQLEAGIEFPADTFKLYVGKIAKLKKPKKKK